MNSVIRMNPADVEKMALSFAMDGIKPLVIIESPFSGPDQQAILHNEAYGRAALRDSILRGEVPLASHLLYTQPGVLNDKDPEERELGMKLGWHATRRATFVAAYMDRGLSSGMMRGIKAAEEMRIPIFYRKIGIKYRDTMPVINVDTGKNDPRFPPNN